MDFVMSSAGGDDEEGQWKIIILDNKQSKKEKENVSHSKQTESPVWRNGLQH
jgi:hypothetical protein